MMAGTGECPDWYRLNDDDGEHEMGCMSECDLHDMYTFECLACAVPRAAEKDEQKDGGDSLPCYALLDKQQDEFGALHAAGCRTDGGGFCEVWAALHELDNILVMMAFKVAENFQTISGGNLVSGPITLSLNTFIPYGVETTEVDAMFDDTTALVMERREVVNETLRRFLDGMRDFISDTYCESELLAIESRVSPDLFESCLCAELELLEEFGSFREPTPFLEIFELG